MLMTIDQLSVLAKPAEHAVACRCGNEKVSILLSPEQVEAEGVWLRNFFRRRIENSREKDKVSFTQTESTCIVRCGHCGTVFRNPQPSQAALKARYSGDHYESGTLEALAVNQALFFAERVREFREWLVPGVEILEVGSFTGAFLKAAAGSGWNATGMDIGTETLAFMRKAGLRVLRGDICECQFAANTWDAIFIWNTFDQLADPHKALDRIVECLKPGGLLVLRIPNGEFK